MVNNFWQSVDAILQDVSATVTIVWCQNINLKTIIFQCSKNYGSPTRVTMQVKSSTKHSRTCQSQRKLTVALMQPSMANLNSPSSRIVKDATPFRRRILRCINFGNGESSPNNFLDVVNLYLIKLKERWILNERAFYSSIISFIWKWIFT